MDLRKGILVDHFLQLLLNISIDNFLLQLFDFISQNVDFAQLMLIGNFIVKLKFDAILLILSILSSDAIFPTFKHFKGIFEELSFSLHRFDFGF